MVDSESGRLAEYVERHFGLVGDDADALLHDMEPVHLAGDEWLFHQGDESDALYLLTRGRLQVWVEPDDDSPAFLLSELAPGDCVGEIGLLTGSPRTAGIRAIRDSHLLKLDKHAFERFASSHPGLGVKLASSIALLLAERTRPNSARSRPVATVAIVPLHEGALDGGFVEQLTERLRRDANVLPLSLDALDALGAPTRASDISYGVTEPLVKWLDDRESEHELVLYVAEASGSPWSRLCIRQADLILLVADNAADPRTDPWEIALLGAEQSKSTQRALILRHDNGASISGTRDWLAHRQVGFHLHLHRDDEQARGRLARLLLGTSNGLVLGGGAARGFAELGAYRALREAGIPIDWVGGTSIGGILGAGMAHYETPDVVCDMAREAFVKGKPFGDYTIPVMSLLRGRRMENLTRNFLPGDIEDLPTPFFCVSSRLDDGDLYVHERGTLWRALRATAALPGMLTPAVIDQRLVVDGAVLNNLPIDIMRQKPVGNIIAVDVSSRRTYSVDYEDVPSPWAVLGSRLLPRRKRHRVPSVVSILMKSAEIGTAAKMRELASTADLLIRPPVDRFGLTDVGNFDRIVDVGYRYTAELLERGTFGARSPD